MSRPARTDADRDARQLAAQLADTRSRLLAELGGDRPGSTVEAAFEDAVRRFADARVRSFVPILVERSVRSFFSREAAVVAEA